ncbi:hypothetical protein GCM10009610_53900 [Pseudonocardia xinjiangensis]
MARARYNAARRPGTGGTCDAPCWDTGTLTGNLNPRGGTIGHTEFYGLSMITGGMRGHTRG